MISDQRQPTVAIVGGGISGLSAAYFLAKQGIRSTLFEKTQRLGGLIGTDKELACELEAGPDSFLASKSAVADLASELGISDTLIDSNDKDRRTFLVQAGELVPMPPGLLLMIPTDLQAAAASQLFTTDTILQLERELSSPARNRDGDFSVRELVEDHFGSEILDKLTEPLLAGVYGGNASILSARSVLPRFVEWEANNGSLIRSASTELARNHERRSIFQSFAGGMQTIIDALNRAILHSCELRFDAAQALEHDGEKGWLVRTAKGAAHFDHAILACPSFAAAALLHDKPELAGQLAGIPYSSALLATFVFEAASMTRRLDGFGFLVPRAERSILAAATWINTKFPSRIPKSLKAIRGFVVGTEAESWNFASDELVIRTVRTDLERLMRFEAEPVWSRLYRWPKSMPQYVVGHGERIQEIERLLHMSPGLHLCGNYLNGVGIPDCVQRARRTAEAITVATTLH